mgnify:CR=1 FL=1|tara:strand:+ start:177 stop:671 length:495 start_codon:yes stop_codon:yes gene_type:complete
MSGPVGDNVLRGSGVIASAAGGVMTPAFKATNSGIQSLSHNTTTKIDFQTELFDTGGTYASSRWTPGEAGTYFIGAYVYISANAVTELDASGVFIFKNGADLADTNIDTRSGGKHYIHDIGVTTVDIADDDDYYEVYARVLDSNGSEVGAGLSATFFYGYKLIT